MKFKIAPPATVLVLPGLRPLYRFLVERSRHISSCVVQLLLENPTLTRAALIYASSQVNVIDDVRYSSAAVHRI
jgi:hypothetical protein